ncbi:MAG: 16S rRNA (uracil(1498)-N(3))-methyltransferase [Streptococcaceae bacterium]|jgi:16S rRNA (uracil1498-N3)-methyltransferase|nr:16S rRNA (uracil(1498)-N(3))-methyltransferase [Streptococcaceae bacterium]
MANQYFINIPLTLETEFRIENPAKHHIFNVMRARNGEKFELVFSDGKIGLAEVTNAEVAEFKVVEEIKRNNELPVKVTIAVGFPKGDKLDFVSEKSTELGATAVWAAPFDWSVVKWNKEKLTRRQEKLMKIAKGAAEQSKRNLIPEIVLFEKFSGLVGRFSEFDKVLIAYEESAKQGEISKFAEILNGKPDKILLIFGPEGGISPKEIEIFTAAGAELVGLGSRILRAETAPLYALSAISALIELQK